MTRNGNGDRRPLVVLTTVGSEDQGRAIAEALVEQEIAACVNILPGLRSIYRWKGKLWDDEELLLFIKTTDDAMDAVVATVRELHSYELPEILALSVERAETAVLDWLRSSVRAKPRDRSSD